MSQRFILSEEEKKSILSQHKSYNKNSFLFEQSNEEMINANRGWQAFLKEKGLYKGEITNDWNESCKTAMKNYQNSIGANADGMWGRNTLETMKTKNPEDYNNVKDKLSQYGDIFDKILHWFGM